MPSYGTERKPFRDFLHKQGSSLVLPNTKLYTDPLGVRSAGGGSGHNNLHPIVTPQPSHIINRFRLLLKVLLLTVLNSIQSFVHDTPRTPTSPGLCYHRTRSHQRHPYLFACLISRHLLHFSCPKRTYYTPSLHFLNLTDSTVGPVLVRTSFRVLKLDPEQLILYRGSVGSPHNPPVDRFTTPVLEVPCLPHGTLTKTLRPKHKIPCKDTLVVRYISTMSLLVSV